MDFSQLHFLYPWWLVLLLALPLVLWLLYAPKQVHWQEWVDAKLAPFVLTGKLIDSQRWQLVILGLIWVLTVCALAGPSWQKREVPVYDNPHALVIGLDLSMSMWAKDVAPDRLNQARFKLLDILAQRKDGQTALVVFAGDAFVVTPLTTDTVTIAEQVKNLTPDIMPAMGSRLAPVITEARQLLTQANARQGDILLITDGVDDETDAIYAAQLANQDGFNVSTLAIGTEKGAPIPIPNKSFLKDDQGKTILAPVNKAAITAVAQAGRGLALETTINDSEIKQLQALWEQHVQDQAPQLQNQQATVWLNAGYWLLIPIIFLMMGIFRRGWLVLAVAFVMSTHPEPVLALELQYLFETPDQQAMQAMHKQEFKQAEQQFQQPDWKAAAAYEGKEWNKAEQYYKNQTSPEARYNYANTLAKQGKFAEALKAYDEVLAQNPKHEDALYNRKLVEAELKKQQAQQQQQDQQKDQQPQQGNSSQQQSGSSSGSKDQDKNAKPQESDQQQNDQRSKPQDQAESKQEKPEVTEQKPEAKRPEQKPSPTKEATQQSEPQSEQSREQQQATEQWLRRIPDDPAELWRRKFLYQYQQRTPQEQGSQW
ncbi:VWA domain-containing protein [Thiofilum flexile]|uniref:VWA domain-containing protein n=1 Tax=Thiofilum flexile TaxID=125627 RepID=UPI00037A18E7|nr:VWA domain-containing protein [Thiofilum flexile]